MRVQASSAMAVESITVIRTYLGDLQRWSSATDGGKQQDQILLQLQNYGLCSGSKVVSLSILPEFSQG